MFSRRYSNFCAAGVMLCSMASSAFAAGCTKYPPSEPASTFPSLNGKLFYHSYVSYNDGTGQIFMLDFASKALTQLSNTGWNVVDPINPVPSPDGNWVAFMGKQNNAWNVFMFRLGSTTVPYNLTGSSGATRNEDVKYSLAGNQIVYKQSGNVVSALVSFPSGVPTLGAAQTLTDTPPFTEPYNENSMPFLSPDAATLYFSTGSGSTLQVWSKRASPGGAVTNVDGASGGPAYYPIVRNDGAVFYTKTPAGSPSQIYIRPKGATASISAPFNDCLSANADAAPVNGTNYVFFSSTTAGGYQLYLGDAVTGKRWSLTPFHVNDDTSKGKFGSFYR